MLRLVFRLVFTLSLALTLCACFIGCDDEKTPPGEFEVSVDSLLSTSAKITWTASEDPDGESVFYDVYFEGTLVSSQTNPVYKVSGLSPETSYSGEIIAFDRSHNKRSVRFTFLTCSEVVFTEIFNSSDWNITITKNTSDAFSKAEFPGDLLRLIAGSGSYNTQYDAKVEATKQATELDLSSFSEIKIIDVTLTFDDFGLHATVNTNANIMLMRLGHLSLKEYTKFSFTSAPVVITSVKYRIIVTANDLKAVTVERFIKRLGNSAYEGPIVESDYLTVNNDQFVKNPLMTFSVSSLRAGDTPAQSYPAYTNRLEIRGIEIKVIGKKVN
jgi:hypothetical protein